MDWKLELIVIPVADVDRAKIFYRDQMGFGDEVDHRGGENFRVVQLTPPGSACAIAFGVGMGDMPPGSMKGLQLVVSDIEAAHAELVERGVEVSAIRHIENGVWLDGPGGPWNSFIFFDDPDGNSWAVQEKPASD